MSLMSTADCSFTIITVFVSHESPFTQRATSGVSTLMPWPENFTVFSRCTIDRSSCALASADTIDSM